MQIGSALPSALAPLIRPSVGADSQHSVQDPNAPEHLHPHQEHGEEVAIAVTESEESDNQSPGQQELTQEQKQQVEELKARDREVRAHEQAHLNAAGGLANGGPKFQFTTGPDGKRYATGGEVSVSLKQGRTPDETIRIARQAQRAANAPAHPSSQDRAVASRAAQMALRAQTELNQSKSNDEDAPKNTSPGNEEQTGLTPLTPQAERSYQQVPRDDEVFCPTCQGNHSADAHGESNAAIQLLG